MKNEDFTPFFPFFDVLSPEEKETISYLSFPQEFSPSECITCGGACQNILLIESGLIRSVLEQGGKTMLLYYLSDGDICVLSALKALFDITLNMNLIAETSVKVIKIPADAYLTLQKAHPEMIMFLRNILMDRFSDVLYVTKSKLLSTSREVVASYLFDRLAYGDGQSLFLTQGAIARDTDVTRSEVSEILSEFERDGVILRERGKITVLDSAMLIN